MASLSNALRGLFSFLTTTSKKEQVVAEHVIREHHEGRSLEEILDDAYVTNRLSPAQIARVLDRTDVLKAIGDDTVAAHRGASSTDAAPTA